MHWYHWMALAAAAVCTAACGMTAWRLIRKGAPRDLSRQRGSIGPAVRFAFTGAMSPARKESAYLHLPTYTAGIVFHLGTFLSLALFPFLLFAAKPYPPAGMAVAAFLLISGMCGLGLFIQRAAVRKLRQLSNPDDYISNLLVSLLHLLTAGLLVNEALAPVYFVLASVLLLYLPVGKLRHTVYFFAARYHLGFFYGWRGIWPPKN